MKTDISALPRREMKHFLGVFQQMGRLQLDSDGNEQSELSLRLLQRQAHDAIGVGSPNRGFRVDDRILLDAMDERTAWTAEKANPGDPEPTLHVDYVDHRTGTGSLLVHGAVAVARKLDPALDLSGLKEVLVAVKGAFAPAACKLFLGQGGARATLATVEDPAPVAGWRLFRADPASLPGGFDLAQVEEYGVRQLDPAQPYRFDFLKADLPIRVVLVPTASTKAFVATPQNPGDVPVLAIDDDRRIRRSTALSVTKAASVAHTLPVLRDLRRARAVLLAAQADQAGTSFTVKLVDAGDNEASLGTFTVAAADAWQVWSAAVPFGLIDLSQVKALRWEGLTPARTYRFAPVLLEMDLDWNLVIMGGDGTSAGAGRFYLDGLAAVKEAHETYFSQADLPEADPTTFTPPAEGKCRRDLVYLDLWERPITYIEDQDIREIALEGPDTCTRTKLVAQVRILKGQEVDAGTEPPAPEADFEALPRCGGGRLTTKDKPDAVLDPCADPCEPEVAGTFVGEENRLYRVEIHECGNIGPAGDPATALFKWSRENGAVASALIADAAAGALSVQVEKPDLFRVGDLIEVSDDLVDLRTGPYEDRTAHRCHEPGELRRISAVNLEDRRLSWEDAGAPDPAFHAPLARGHSRYYHAKVRRWDGVRAVTAGDVVLDDGVVVEFGGEGMVPGDFWVFTARVVDRSVERLIEEPPHGLRHRYVTLATVTRCTSGGATTQVVEDLRAAFSPLTGLRATDVAYDPGQCIKEDAQWAQVGTVQEALDALCRLSHETDLTEHNRLLHGYGVVCGLKVVCNHVNREQVIVQPGHALDCQGRPIRVTLPLPVEAVAKAAELGLLDHAGNGEVCLTIARGVAQEAAVSVEAHKPQGFWDGVLEGTLLKDFYEHCIENLLVFLKASFLPFTTTAVPVPANQRRIISFLNLLWQLVNPSTGQYVFLAHHQDPGPNPDPAKDQEHEYLKKFYDALRDMLESETFCAMFDHVAPFPAYPYQVPAGIRTAFGLFQFHTRLRLHPGGRYAYTCGEGNRIHVYDMQEGELTQSLQFPGGSNVDVKDVAFKADGSELYAVGLNGQDSIFATATIGANQSHAWGPTTVVCDIKFVALATRPAGASLYAIGKARGLYVFNPAAIPLTPTADVAFNATGILRLSPDGAAAYAAENASLPVGTETGTFTRFRSINLNSLPAAPVFYTVAGSDGANDAAVHGTTLFVTGNPAPGHAKTLWAFNAATGAQLPAPQTDLLVNTETRLAVLADRGHLLVTLADHNKVVRVGLSTRALDTAFRMPAQIAPLDLVVKADGSEAVVLNYLSNTLSLVKVTAVYDAVPLPDYTDEPPASLSVYRQAILEAYEDILEKFFQYLKDCFCDQFLVECPTCGPDDKVYLGCVEIKNRKVYHICNFTKRRYVKSFDTYEYWLSTVPILPLLKQLLAKFCCKVL